MSEETLSLSDLQRLADDILSGFAMDVIRPAAIKKLCEAVKEVATPVPSAPKTWAKPPTAAAIRWMVGEVELDATFKLRSDRTLLAICQVQLKKPTGNRWLFSLGDHFLDYTLERMAEAFPGEPLLLVSGGSAAEFVASNYTADKRPGYEVLRRIDELYSRPLKAWDRRATPIKMGYLGGRSFHELVRLPEKD